MFILSEKEPQNRSIVFPSVLNKFFKWCWARAALGDQHNGVDGSQHRCCRIVSKNFFFLFWENVVKILLKKNPDLSTSFPLSTITFNSHFNHMLRACLNVT